MAQARKDSKGHTFRKGESYRVKQQLYCYSYMNPFGKRSFIYAKSLFELRQKETTLQRNQLDGLNVYVAGKATVNYVFDRYISTKTELRKTTESNYRYVYDRYIRKSFGLRKISEVKYSDVLRYYQELLRKGLGISTVENVHTLLHPTFHMAVRDDIIRTNPTDGVLGEIKKKSKEHGVRKALTIEQQNAFITALQRTENRRWYPIFTVMLDTGMRVGETIGLRWKDVDLKKGFISVNHQIVYYPKPGEKSRNSVYMVSLPKTNQGIRYIPILPEVAAAFEEEKKFQKSTEIWNEQTIDGMDGFIFCNRFGGMFNESSLNRAIHRICEGYNRKEEVDAKRDGRRPVLLPNFSCHVLRHTFCTRLCELETNVKVIQSVMGHADITTTMNIYADCTEDKKKESFDKLVSDFGSFDDYLKRMVEEKQKKEDQDNNEDRKESSCDS